MKRRGALYPVSGRGERRKNGRAWRKILLVGFCLSAVLWGGQALCTVREIRVSGSRLLEREQVAAAAGVQAGRNILLFSPSRAAARLEELPLVRRAAVARSFPWTVHITLEEREPAAAVPAVNGFWTVDREGVVIGGPSPLSGDLPVVTGLEAQQMISGEAVLNREQGQALERLLRTLAQYPGLEVSELNVGDPGDLLLFTLDGLQVLLGDSADLELKLELVWQSMPYWHAAGGRCVDARLADRLVVSP